MNPFDIPIISARQVWHDYSYVPSGGMRESAGKSSLRKARSPGYESGPGEIIRSIKEDDDTYHLWVLGECYWSAWVEGSDERKVRFSAQTASFLCDHIRVIDKPHAWKNKAYRLAQYAVFEVKHRNPPDMSSTRSPLYTKAFLEERLGIGARHFDRDAGEQWDYLTGQLEAWVGQALKPLAKWVEQKRDAA